MAHACRVCAWPCAVAAPRCGHCGATAPVRLDVIVDVTRARPGAPRGDAFREADEALGTVVISAHASDAAPALAVTVIVTATELEGIDRVPRAQLRALFVELATAPPELRAATATGGAVLARAPKDVLEALAEALSQVLGLPTHARPYIDLHPRPPTVWERIITPRGVAIARRPVASPAVAVGSAGALGSIYAAAVWWPLGLAALAGTIAAAAWSRRWRPATVELIGDQLRCGRHVVAIDQVTQVRMIPPWHPELSPAHAVRVEVERRDGRPLVVHRGRHAVTARDLAAALEAELAGWRLARRRAALAPGAP